MSEWGREGGTLPRRQGHQVRAPPAPPLLPTQTPITWVWHCHCSSDTRSHKDISPFYGFWRARERSKKSLRGPGLSLGLQLPLPVRLTEVSPGPSAGQRSPAGGSPGKSGILRRRDPGGSAATEGSGAARGRETSAPPASPPRRLVARQLLAAARVRWPRVQMRKASRFK